VFPKILIKISGVCIIKYKSKFFPSNTRGTTSEQSARWQQALDNQTSKNLARLSTPRCLNDWLFSAISWYTKIS
jgi:hypothetical protein